MFTNLTQRVSLNKDGRANNWMSDLVMFGFPRFGWVTMCYHTKKDISFCKLSLRKERRRRNGNISHPRNNSHPQFRHKIQIARLITIIARKKCKKYYLRTLTLLEKILSIYFPTFRRYCWNVGRRQVQNKINSKAKSKKYFQTKFLPKLVIKSKSTEETRKKISLIILKEISLTVTPNLSEISDHGSSIQPCNRLHPKLSSTVRPFVHFKKQSQDLVGKSYNLYK